MGIRQRPTIRHLTDLVPLIERQQGFDEIVAALKRGESATIDGAWGSTCALSLAALSREAPGTLLVVLPRLPEVDDLAYDLSGFVEEPPRIFSAWEGLPRGPLLRDPVLGGRLELLRELQGEKPPRVVVTSIAALLQPFPDPEEIESATLRLAVGETLDPQDLLRWLHERGCERVTTIEMPGEYVVHGGIVDVYPPDAAYPLRIEFFGDEVESIRQFDVQTQQRVSELKTIAISILPEADWKGLLDVARSGRQASTIFPEH